MTQECVLPVRLCTFWRQPLNVGHRLRVWALIFAIGKRYNSEWELFQCVSANLFQAHYSHLDRLTTEVSFIIVKRTRRVNDCQKERRTRTMSRVCVATDFRNRERRTGRELHGVLAHFTAELRRQLRRAADSWCSAQLAFQWESFTNFIAIAWNAVCTWSRRRRQTTRQGCVTERCGSREFGSSSCQSSIHLTDRYSIREPWPSVTRRLATLAHLQSSVHGALLSIHLIFVIFVCFIGAKNDASCRYYLTFHFFSSGYTPCTEKRCHFIFACNSAKCQPIFKFFNCHALQ